MPKIEHLKAHFKVRYDSFLTNETRTSCRLCYKCTSKGKKSIGGWGGSQTRGNSHGGDDFLSYRTKFLFPGQPQWRLPDHSSSQERRGAKPTWIYRVIATASYSTEVVASISEQCRSSLLVPLWHFQHTQTCIRRPSTKYDTDLDTRHFFLKPAHSKCWTSMLASYTIKISHLSNLWINWDLNIKIVAGFSIIFSLDLTLYNNCNFSNVSIRLLCICPCYISALPWRLTSGGTNWMSHDHEVDSGNWGAECWMC